MEGFTMALDKLDQWAEASGMRINTVLGSQRPKSMPQVWGTAHRLESTVEKLLVNNQLNMSQSLPK